MKQYSFIGEIPSKYVDSCKAIHIKCFVSHRPTDPFFLEKWKKNPRITCKEVSTLIYKLTILSY